MKYSFSALCIAAVLCASCSNQQTAQVENASSEQPAAERPQTEAIFYEVLPDPGIRFNFPFHLKQDRVYVTNKGPTIRGVVFEFLDGDASGAFRNVSSSLEIADYVPVGDIRTDADGKRKQTYKKEGSPNLNVLVQDYPSSVTKTAHPNGKGIIQISWQLVAAQPAAGSETASTQ